MPMSRASGSVLSSSLAAGSTGIEIVTRFLLVAGTIMAHASGSRQHGGPAARKVPRWNRTGGHAVLLVRGNARVGRCGRKEPGRRVPARMDGVSMTPHMKWAIGGI